MATYNICRRTQSNTWNRLVAILSISLLLLLYLLFISPPAPPDYKRPPLPPPPLALNHIVFGIASSSLSYPNRHPYIRTWWKPNFARGCVFLDRPIQPPLSTDNSLPPLLISRPTSHIPYTFPRGLRSAVRVARIVKELVDLNLSHVRWFVLGDDDTVFFTHNLVKVLSKYDHNRWFYVGANSESFHQNLNNSFEMAFGGAGFALSYPLAKVLASVLDSCLFRYSHLYGSDSRIFSCLAELGVALTHESGFHQVDMRGDLFGMLSAHPLAPLLSLHHLDSAQPIFPDMNRTQALEKLFLTVQVDPERILQQTVCYDRSKSLTISVSWGYSVQVFEGNQLLPDLLPLQRTFVPWRRSVNVNSHPFMFNTRDFPRDPCKRSAVFFVDNVFHDANKIQTNYVRHNVKICPQKGSLKSLEQIRVMTQKLDHDVGELQAPRRHCCDVVTSTDTMIEVSTRQCGDKELISMSP